MSYRSSYHATVLDARRQEYEHKAQKQDEVVYAFFLANAGKSFTPFEIQRACMPTAPITSVRRALTNLTNADRLVKGGQRDGDYGRANHTWMLKPVYKQTALF